LRTLFTIAQYGYEKREGENDQWRMVRHTPWEREAVRNLKRALDIHSKELPSNEVREALCTVLQDLEDHLDKQQLSHAKHRPKRATHRPMGRYSRSIPDPQPEHRLSGCPYRRPNLLALCNLKQNGKNEAFLPIALVLPSRRVLTESGNEYLHFSA
jgi:hypothetical protein